jgi:hypothetical protein
MANYQAQERIMTWFRSGGGVATVTTPITVKPIGAASMEALIFHFLLVSRHRALSSFPQHKNEYHSAADPVDGKVTHGNRRKCTIDFSPSEGPITKYVIDKISISTTTME